MNFETDLFKFVIDKNLSISLELSIFTSIAIILIIFILILIRFVLLNKYQSLEIDEAELGIGNQKVKIKANYLDMQIAYKLWVEISTRKIGIPIDLENDLIHEIYKSWYNFFNISRDLIKDIPISKYRNKKTSKIIDIAVKILNTGMRPHLTKWQGKYQKWYFTEVGKDENNFCEPQEIQKKYPKYENIINELRDVNSKLILYKNVLSEIIK